jgi:two-component system, LytTR family, response regulator
METFRETPSSNNARPAAAGGRAPFRAMILDASEEDRRYLGEMMRRHPSVQILHEAAGLAEAAPIFEKRDVDVLFLDPAGMGTEVLAKTPHNLKIVFTTRDASYAVTAFEIEAVHFLPKPVDAARLAEAVRRLLRIEWRPPLSSPPAQSEAIMIPFERGRKGVPLEDIRVIQAFGNYTRVAFSETGSELVLRSLNRWEQSLPEDRFLRVHRNTIVNLGHVRELASETHAENCVLRVAGVEDSIPVSRRHVAELKKRLYGNA